MDIMIKINNTQNYKDKLVCEGVLKLVDSKPIIVSESEKIEAGDWVYNEVSKEIYQFKENHVSYEFKILALPEHFSPQQLQDIVDGKLKEGKCLVECETRILRPELGAIFEGPSGLEYLNDTIIKLNPHITIYPVEEKMYTKKDFDEFCEWIDTWWRRGKTKKG